MYHECLSRISSQTSWPNVICRRSPNIAAAEYTPKFETPIQVTGDTARRRTNSSLALRIGAWRESSGGMLHHNSTKGGLEKRGLLEGGLRSPGEG